MSGPGSPNYPVRRGVAASIVLFIAALLTSLPQWLGDSGESADVAAATDGTGGDVALAAAPIVDPPNPIFASIGDVILTLPGDVLEIGFHEATRRDSFGMAPIGVAVSNHNTTRHTAEQSDYDHDLVLDTPGQFADDPSVADITQPEPEVVAADDVGPDDPDAPAPMPVVTPPAPVIPPAPTALEGFRTHRIMSSRGRRPAPTSAVDLMMDATSLVRSPVDGVVVDVKPYILEGRYPDHRIDIIPYADPTKRVVMLHVLGPRVTLGSHVVAGETIIATSPNLFRFSSQIDRYRDDGIKRPHVHIEVKDRSAPVIVVPEFTPFGPVLPDAEATP